ncbi:MAG: hypothetical protein LBG81_08700, partial [Coriobacteriaceae bacterium]|nr:hypothetical protein [Coriobacteriaceae bacterium]
MRKRKAFMLNAARCFLAAGATVGTAAATGVEDGGTGAAVGTAAAAGANVGTAAATGVGATVGTAAATGV